MSYPQYPKYEVAVFRDPKDLQIWLDSFRATPDMRVVGQTVIMGEVWVTIVRERKTGE